MISIVSITLPTAWRCHGNKKFNNKAVNSLESALSSAADNRPLQSIPIMVNSYNLMHYSDIITGAIPSQITSLTIVYSTVYSGADQRKHQSSTSLAFVRGIHRWPVKSPHIWPVTRKMFPFADVIMGRPYRCTYTTQTWSSLNLHIN